MSSVRGEIEREGLGGAGTGADRVLDVLAKLGKGLVKSLRDKDRIVAEALCAAFFGSDEPVHHPFEEVFLSIIY